MEILNGLEPGRQELPGLRQPLEVVNGPGPVGRAVAAELSTAGFGLWEKGAKRALVATGDGLEQHPAPAELD